MGVPGHNGGPSLEGGISWRRHCWTRAREALLPTLPIEVGRLRVRRARELGLDYKTYASVRASTGHDVVGFLFSSNALRITTRQAAMPPDRAGRLAAVTGAVRIALAVGPLSPLAVMAANAGALDAAHDAPFALAQFRELREALRAALGRIPADQVILVGDMALERDWSAAGRLAGYLSAERYFG